MSPVLLSIHPTPRVLRLLSILITLVPIGIFLWLLNQQWIITPSVSLRYVPGHPNVLIRPEPAEGLMASLSSSGKLQWQVQGDELKFSVRYPRGPERVRVRMNLSIGGQSQVSLTAQGRNGIGSITRIESSTFLNQLPWNVLPGTPFTVWQRPDPSVRQYTSVPDFLQTPPAASRVASVGLDQYALFRIPNYQPATEDLHLPYTLRGSHAITLYTGGEPIHLKFQKTDLNRIEGKDTLIVSVVQDGRTVWNRTVGDDGTTDASRTTGAPTAVEVTIPGVPAGIYRVELRAEEDVLISQIESSQHVLAFDRKIFLAGGPSYLAGASLRPRQFVVFGSTVGFETPHANALPRLTVAGKTYSASRAKKLITVPISRGATVSLSGDDVQLTANGWIFPAETVPMDPQPIQVLPPTANPDVKGVDYILANYSPSESNGSLAINETFNADELAVNDHRFHFALGLPGRTFSSATVRVDWIRVTLERGPIPWSKIISKFQSAILHEPVQ